MLAKSLQNLHSPNCGRREKLEDRTGKESQCIFAGDKYQLTTRALHVKISRGNVDPRTYTGISSPSVRGSTGLKPGLSR